MDMLAAAVRAGDAAGARAALAAHPGLATRLDEALAGGAFGETALLTAVHCGDRKMAELLLDAGADIDARSHWWAGGFGVLDGESPLLPWLIDRGAKVNACAAARHGMLDRLRTLLEADPAMASMRGGDGQTPLHVARTVEVAACLLDHGADIDALDVDHESTPAQYLVRERPAVARYLVSRGARSDLLLAAALGDLALVQARLDDDPDSIRLSVTPEHFPMRDPLAGGTIYIWTLGIDKTPHGVAREFGHADVFQYLMSRSPESLQLAAACQTGDEALARRLLARTPGLVRSLTESEQRRLPAAAMDHDLSTVRLMLSLGWPTDARGKEGGTALHWAAFHGHAEMVREILRYKPDLAIKDMSFGGTALDWAQHGAEHGWRRETGNYAGTIELLSQ